MSLRHRARQAFNRLARPLGVKLVSASTRETMAEVLEAAKSKGLAPKTLIDVGITYRRRDLWEAFPDADLLLIEPLHEWEPTMRELATARGARYALAAAGSSSGSVAIRVPPILPWVSAIGSDHEQRTVPRTTVDEQVRLQELEGPFLLKVDVDGFEADVLEGATQTLEESSAVILETWLEGTFVPLIGLMADRGFVPFDIYEFGYRASDQVLAKVDVVFVRADSPMRAE